MQGVLREYPQHPFARNLLGLAALKQGDPAQAAQHFEAAIASAPAELPLLGNLASAHRLQGNDAGERQALEAALLLDQRHLATRIRLGELHERRGETHEATMHWSSVVALSAHIDQPSPELAERFAHAKAFVARQTDALAQAIEDAMQPRLANASSRDRRRTVAASQVMLGRRPVYVNECDGMHYPFLPADEYFDAEHFPWFAELESATDTIRQELLQLLAASEDLIKPYVDQASGTPENKWSVLNRKRDWSAIHLWKEGVRQDKACAGAPQTAALVEQLPLCRIPGRAPTVFFSLLKAGAHIPAHTGVTNTRAIVHLPLIVPQGCRFRVGGETREWREGEAFAFDDTIDHEAWNDSDQDRVVLILDTWNPHLSEDEQALITTMFETADRARLAAA